MSSAKKFKVNGVVYDIDVNAAETIAAAQAAADAANAAAANANALQENLEDGNVVPAMAVNLESWEEQNAPVKDKWSGQVRTTGGETPIKTSEGGCLSSIVPESDFTAKSFIEGPYNLLKLTQLNKATIGGELTGGYYFIVPKLTFGSYGTAEENNGVLFTDNNSDNLKPTVRFKALTNGIPSSVSDGNDCAYTDSNGYRFFTTPGAGYLIVSGITLANTCAHIAWEDWYDKYVALSEADTNPEAKVGVLELEAFFALIHSDKILRTINSSVKDYVEFGEASAKGYHVCDTISVAAYSSTGVKWTDTANEQSEGQSQTYTHSVNISSMKADGAAKILGGITLTVNGTIASYIDSNEHAEAATVVYERSAVAVVSKAYTDSVFSGSNINTTTGKLPVNDCSIEAFVGMSGEAIVAMSYAQNLYDTAAEIARRRMTEAEECISEDETRVEDLESEVLLLAGGDFEQKYGQPRELYAHGTPAESRIPDNWVQLEDGGYNWTGKPSALGQVYNNVDNLTGAGSIWKAYKKSNYELDWMPAN